MGATPTTAIAATRMTLSALPADRRRGPRQRWWRAWGWGGGVPTPPDRWAFLRRWGGPSGCAPAFGWSPRPGPCPRPGPPTPWARGPPASGTAAGGPGGG